MEFLCVVSSLNLQIRFNYTIISAQMVLDEIDSLNTTVDGSVAVDLSDQLTAVAAAVDSPDAATSVLDTFNNLLNLTDPSTLDLNSAAQLVSNTITTSTSASNVATNGSSQLLDNAITNLIDLITNVLSELPATVTGTIIIRDGETVVVSRVIPATDADVPLSLSTPERGEPLVLILPSNLLSGNTRVTLIASDGIVGRSASLGGSVGGVISSSTVSIGIPGVGRDTVINPPLELVLVLTMSIDTSTSEPLCVFWNEGTQFWDSDGVVTVFANGIVTCQTSHLSAFSVLVIPSTPTTPSGNTSGNTSGTPPGTQNLALRIISYILLSLSLIALVISLILFIVCKKSFFKEELNRMYFNYAVALTLAVTTLIFGVNIGVLNEVLCIIISIWFHYTWLALFSWSLAIAILITYMLTFAVKSKKIFWLLFALAWLLPLPIVIITLIFGVFRGDYVRRDENCFLSLEYLWSLLAPILVIIILNTIAYVVCIIRIIMFSINKVASDISPNLKQALISGIILLPVLGVPWIVILLNFIIAQFTPDSPVFVWVFLLLNGPVGVVFFAVYTLPNKAVQHTIWTKILRKDTELPRRTKVEEKHDIPLEQVQPKPRTRDVIFSNRSAEGNEAIDV